MSVTWERPVLIDKRVRQTFIGHGNTYGDWVKGRQGTGYEIMNLKHVPELKLWIDYLLVWVRQANTNEFWDAYLIRYQDGAYVPPHKDEATIYGMRHNRLNVMLQNPIAGGEFLVEGKHPIDSYSGDEMPGVLPEGDAYHFWPDETLHEVTPVVGTRLILSVGAWI